MRSVAFRLVWLVVLLSAPLVFAAGKAEHVVVVGWDGMRPDFITPEHTPTLYQLARDGVMFQNHHSVYCTSTEVNGTAIATGAYPAHSGIMANRDYRPEIDLLKAVDTQSLTVVRKGDQLTGGHYLLRPTVPEILQAAGRKTAIAGSKAVALLHDRRERADDSPTGVNVFEGRTLPPSALATFTNLFGPFPPKALARLAIPNEKRDEWTTRVMLGPLWSNGVPAYSLLWLSEPDFSQHASGPGSKQSLAALATLDRRLADVLGELERRNLRDKTDVFVVSDHGFSTVERSVHVTNALRQAGFRVLHDSNAPPEPGSILIVGQGSSVLFYVIGHDAEVARKLVEFLQQQDFSGVIFTRERMDGTFTLDEANLNTPHAPDVVMSMRWSAEKSKTGAPGLFASEGNARSGTGGHGGLGRFDVNNILVGAGPDLKQGFTDTMPTGNTDIAPTILWLLGVKPDQPMDGRVLSEALTADAPPANPPTTRRIEASCAHTNLVWHQYLQISQVNQTIYFDEGNGYTTPK